MAEPTRARSTKKPADHKPAEADLVKVEFADQTFEVRPGAFTRLAFLDLLERNQLTTALRYLVGDEAFGEFLAANPDADGETASNLLEAIAEKAGTKN